MYIVNRKQSVHDFRYIDITYSEISQCRFCARCGTVNYNILAFTWPKVSQEVGVLNWAQLHKSVWDGPTTTPPSLHVIGSCHCRITGQHAGEQAIAHASARGPWGLSQSGPFCTVFLILHIKGQNFPDVLSVHVYLWPLWTMKSFMEISPDVFEKSGKQTHTHTQTDAAALYIYR